MTKAAHWSLGFFKAQGYRISVFCPNAHGAEIDLDIAIRTFGPDLTDLNSWRFLQQYRCHICGEPGHSVSVQPPGA